MRNVPIYRALLLLLSCVGLFSACKKDPSIDQPIWQNVTDTSIAMRNAPVSFAIGTKAYVGLGGLPLIQPSSIPISPSALRDFWAIDLTTKKWQKLTDFPGVSRSFGSGFTVNGRAYIAGGSSGNSYQNTIWEYNADNDSWKQVALLKGEFQFMYVQSFVINNQVYLMNNYDVIKFDPLTYQLTAMKPFPMETVGSGAFVINGKAYRFMGASSTKQQAVYEYDPTKDNWIRKGDFPGEARGLMATFSLNGYGYLIGGYQEPYPYLYYKDCWQYDPSSDRWTQLADYPGTGRHGLVSSVVGNTAIVGFGQLRADQFGFNDMWLFQPK